MAGSVTVILQCPKCGYISSGTQTYDGHRVYVFFAGGRDGECPSCGSTDGVGMI